MINGHPTAEDAAREFKVSAKTVNNWVDRWVKEGLLPEPPTFEYGLRTVRSFPPAYVEKIRKVRDKLRGAGK